MAETPDLYIMFDIRERIYNTIPPDTRSCIYNSPMHNNGSIAYYSIF